MSLVVLDTDVASAILRDRLDTRIATRLVGRQPVVTFVTVGELAKWTELRSWGPQRLASLDAFYRRFRVLPYSPEIPGIWGHIQAAAQRRGRPRPVNDSWIAACCLDYGLLLATQNRKDFEDFVNHEGLRLL